MNWTDRMLQDTISYMSVSDPAPLPRLGEVFFDVRGNSRSMRLSWYADTGVAVFSIWQAGMCTGTFRLPMADLSRMIEILERGPTPRGRGRAPVRAAPPGDDRGPDPDWYYGQGTDEPSRAGASGNSGGYGAEPPAGYGGSGYEADYGRAERGSGEYGGGEQRPADYGSGGYGQSGHGSSTSHQSADFDSGYTTGGYGSGDYGAAADEHYQGSGYGSADPDYRTQGHPAEYGRGDHADGGGYRRGYEPGGGHERGGYGAPEAEHRTGEYPGYADDRRAGSDRGYRSGDYDDRPEFRAATEADSSGYRDQGFAGPYVGDRGQAYPNNNPAPASGYQGDIGDVPYPADRRPVSPSDHYPEPSAPEEAYSYGADYRYR